MTDPAETMTDGDAYLRDAVRRRGSRRPINAGADPGVDLAPVAEAVRQAATGRLADPSDAVAMLDLGRFVDGIGAVVPSAITTAIDELVATKPYLGLAAVADTFLRDTVRRQNDPAAEVDPGAGEPVAPVISPAPQGTRAGPPLPNLEGQMRALLDPVRAADHLTHADVQQFRNPGEPGLWTAISPAPPT